MSRKLATIRRIDEVKSIPGADKICAYRVGGWWVVDSIGKYNVDDYAIYCEVDSWIPTDVAPFLSKGQEPREYNGVKGERLRTLKLRGQISQGLLLPLDPSFIIRNIGAGPGARFEDYAGMEVSTFLGIQKWEPPIPAQLSGVVKGTFPSFILKTDQERCQNLQEEIFTAHAGETYEVTLKLDGSSMTVYVKDGEVGVCSRNLDLKETVDNTFWKVARKQRLIHALMDMYERTGRSYALQGELIGEGIQGNPEKISGQRFYLFDVYDINDGRYLYADERTGFLALLAGYDMFHAPVLDTVVVTDKFSSIDEILAYAEGPSLNPSTPREGVVFKSLNSPFTFTAISNTYLLKNTDR